MNPLQDLTPETIELMKNDAYERHVIAQGKKIHDHITKLIDWQARKVKSICLGSYDFSYIYPQNIKILSCNGFDVYKVAYLNKVKNDTFYEHHITWGDTNIEKDILPNIFTQKEYTIIDCKKLV